MKKFAILLLLVTVGLTSCSPKMRFKPGDMPQAVTPPGTLKTEAENYVTAHISQLKYREIESGPELKRLKRIVERLAVGAGYAPRTFPVHLVDAGKEVNAAAFNGASIVVYKELMNKVPSDEGLATVLGHEVGHILAEHYKDAAEEEARAQNVGAASSILGTIADVAVTQSGYGSLGGIAGTATETVTGAIGYGAFVGSFNRTQEYEADHLGLLIMARAGYDPEKAVEFWQNAAEIFGGSTSTVGSFFSTHPAFGDRMSSLKDALPYAQKAFKPSVDDMEPEPAHVIAKKKKKK